MKTDQSNGGEPRQPERAVGDGIMGHGSAGYTTPLFNEEDKEIAQFVARERQLQRGIRNGAAFAEHDLAVSRLAATIPSSSISFIPRASTPPTQPQFEYESQASPVVGNDNQQPKRGMDGGFYDGSSAAPARDSNRGNPRGGQGGDATSAMHRGIQQDDDKKPSVKDIPEGPPGSMPQPQAILGVLPQDGRGKGHLGHETSAAPEGNRGGDQRRRVSFGTARECITDGRRSYTRIPIQERPRDCEELGSSSPIDVDAVETSRATIVFVAMWGYGDWKDVLDEFTRREYERPFSFFPPSPRRAPGVVRRADSSSRHIGNGRVQTIDDVAAQAMSGLFEPPNQARVQGGLGQFHLLGRGIDRTGNAVGILLPTAGGRGPSDPEDQRPYGVPPPQVPPRVFSEFPGGTLIICNALAGWCCKQRRYGRCTECARRAQMELATSAAPPSFRRAKRAREDPLGRGSESMSETE